MSQTATLARRKTARKQPRMSVEEMLREIAYNLHATRKLTADEVWPAKAREPRPLVVGA